MIAGSASATALVSRLIGAELVRTRRTTGLGLILAGLVISVLQGLGWAFLSTRALTSWDQLTAWQVAYVTGLAIPLAALLGVVTVRREQRAREGGTAWREPSPFAVQVARASVAGASLLALDAAVVLPTLLWGLIGHLPGPPVGRLVALTVLAWVLQWPALLLGLWLTRWVGAVPTLLVAVAWQAAGAVQAESPQWWALPWTWLVRPLLPLIGTHQNGVALEPGSPVWAFGWWQPLVGSLGLALALLCLQRVQPRPLRHRRRIAVTRTAPSSRAVVPLTRVRPRATVGLAASLLRTCVPWLVAFTLAGLVPVEVLWGPGGVRGLLAYALLPLGSCLLAVLAWQSQADVWRSLATRRSIPDLGVRLLSVCSAIVAAVAAEAAGLIAMGHGSDALTSGLVAALSGSAGVACCLFLTTRYGAGTAIGVTLGALVIGVILGSNFGATPLWLAAPTAWAETATSPERAVIACVLSVGFLVAATMLWLRAVNRHVAAA